MDSDDRRRIDENMDKIRGNEETLKHQVQLETSAINSIYDVVANASNHIDEKLKWIQENTETFAKEVESKLRITDGIKEILNIEEELLETGEWISQLTDSIKSRQNLILTILTGQELSIQNLIQLVDIRMIMGKLREQEKNVPKGTQFPRKRSGKIFPELLQGLKYTIQTNTKAEVIINLRVPLVKEITFEALQGILSPGVQGSIITLSEMEKPVMILDRKTETGYMLSITEYDECNKIGDTRICQVEAPQEKLRTDKYCMTELYFLNNSNTCATRIVKATGDTWIATINRNEWLYVAPLKTKVQITQEGNVTELEIIGTGKIQIARQMILRTENVIITFYDYEEAATNVLPEVRELNFSKFTPELIQNNQIPPINESKYEFISKKSLFEVGIDVKTIEEGQYNLDNLKDAPLENPWMTTTSILVICGIVIVSIFGFRGKISCCKRQGDTIMPTQGHELQEIKNNTVQENRLVRVI
uniref:Putative arac family transcriptional regulator n=1 Tax=Anopheles darlingi TaxID=43151 RepID=A0A2M4CX51_ANODA